MHNKELTSANILRTISYKDYTKFPYFNSGVIDHYKDTLLSGKTLYLNEVITILTEAVQ